MKLFTYLCSSLSLSFAISAFSTSTVIVEETDIDFDKIFVPKGFDSNDNAEIVIAGKLPNTCYKKPTGKVSINGDQILVEMKATKVSGPEVVCIMALVPYVVSVDLGQLEIGKYDIHVNLGTISEQNSAIRVGSPSSASINNYSYANVTNVKEIPSEKKIVFEGIHPSSCMEIDRVEIYPNETNDTFSVLPIIKATQPVCDDVMTPFTYVIDYPVFPIERILLHIRKIDGTALNYLVDDLKAQ